MNNTAKNKENQMVVTKNHWNETFNINNNKTTMSKIHGCKCSTMPAATTAKFPRDCYHQ